MKNLSKVFALVLSLAFVLTMFAGAVNYPNAAAFTDTATIQSAYGQKAVSVLSSLEILNGFPEGDEEEPTYAIRADENVQRNQYAKMVACAAGEKESTILTLFNVTTMPEYVDVPDGAWYIPYCVYALYNGIMVGYGNGMLKPTANVTGYEALKMTLVALGYDAETEGLVGISWKNNTTKLASKVGLLKGLDDKGLEANIANALTREATAVIIYNALFADVVSYDGGTAVSTGKTLGEKAFALTEKDVAVKSVNKVTNEVTFTDNTKVVVAEFEPQEGDVYTVLTSGSKVISAALKDSAALTAGEPSYGKVLKVETKTDYWNLKVAGMSEAVDVYAAPTVAAGDFVKVTKTGLWYHYTAADKFVGTVTKYVDNSSTEIGTDTGVGETTAADVYTITDDAGKMTGDYTFAVESLNANEIEYFETLMGAGSAAVNDVKLQYTVIDNKIFNVELVDETYWANYAIVVATGTDEALGMASVRYLTDDNEYKYSYVSAFNGEQIYNNIVSVLDYFDNEGGKKLTNKLVRYYVTGENTIALYTADYKNVQDQYCADKVMSYDIDTGLWEGHDYDTTGVQNATAYTWDNATVFVSYGDSLNGNANAYLEDVEASSHALLWRAYKVGEFQPYSDDEVSFEASMSDNTRKDYDEIVYANGLNNVSVLKAAAIVFENDSELPGLVLRDNMIWATITAKTSVEYKDSKYVYTITYLDTNGDNAKITYTTSNPENTFIVGDVYKFFLNDDGTLRRWEVAATAATVGQYGEISVGSNYLELYKFVGSGIVDKGNGNYLVQVKYPSCDGDDFTAEKSYLKITPDTDMYFVENLFTTDIKSFDPDLFTTSLGYMAWFEDAEIFADINPTTKEVYSIWVNKGAEMKTEYKANIKVSASYDEDNEKITYTIHTDGIKTEDLNNTIVIANAKPYDLLMPVESTDESVESIYECQVTVNYDASNGGWFIKDVTTVEEAAALIDTDFEWSTVYVKNDNALNYWFFKDTSAANGVTYLHIEVPETAGDQVIYQLWNSDNAGKYDVQGWLLTSKGLENAVDPIFGKMSDTHANYQDVQELLMSDLKMGDWSIESAGKTAKAITFTKLHVMYKLNGIAYVLVFDDATADESDAGFWPYFAYTAD